ncbi:hypothetical protein L210DRAFT_3540707 [Boletus edulis BED1]|uniref:Uncharacterized protein n=1 Tax=Boletus edulis BED1 TaxID=1328754 RepID=A0AAD4GEG2_BOLED|nr:hypothetical protein L210DRAFT_3540707 [Boletus edulis BED1]
MAAVHTLAFGQVAPAAAGVIQFSPSSYLLRGVLPPALRPLRLTGPVPVPSNSESDPDGDRRGIATLPSHALSPTSLCASPMTSPLSRKLFGPARRGVWCSRVTTGTLRVALDGMHRAASMWIPVWWVRNSTHCFPFRSWQMRNARSHTEAMFLFFDSMGCKTF